MTVAALGDELMIKHRSTGRRDSSSVAAPLAPPPPPACRDPHVAPVHRRPVAS